MPAAVKIKERIASPEILCTFYGVVQDFSLKKGVLVVTSCYGCGETRHLLL
jgi:hypothetical protein